MLQLRPTCENCNTPLPPASTDAMICSYECTYCRSCAKLLSNVCPNCGGAFEPRPIRPNTAWIAGLSLHSQPASDVVIHRPVDLAAHHDLVVRVGAIAPSDR